MKNLSNTKNLIKTWDNRVIMPTTNQLEELLKVASRYGVTKLITAEFEVELKPVVPQEPVINIQSQANGLTPSKVELSEEDMLFWSSEAPKQESK